MRVDPYSSSRSLESAIFHCSPRATSAREAPFMSKPASPQVCQAWENPYLANPIQALFPRDFSKVRNAWLFDVITKGKLMSSVVPDGDYERVDPARHISKDWPPTFFLHGTEDGLVLARFSEQAHEELKALEVATELRLVDGAEHAFDEPKKVGDEGFKVIWEGPTWLAARAGLT
jgi:acetyl esterase/lipase